MITVRSLTIVIFCSVLLTSLTHAQDLSRYRDFQFGMNLPTVAKQADLKQSDARAVHQRPAIIEELEWRPQSFLRTSPRPQGDPVKDVLFSFYNGELFRMVVNLRNRKPTCCEDDQFLIGPGLQRDRKGYGTLGRLAVLVQPLPLLLPA